MKKIELLYLSQEDVVSVGITMEETIRIVEGALREHGLGKFENPPKRGVHPKNGFIHAMPGYLPRKKAAGLKWVSSFSNNTALGIPPVMGLYILNDVRTGRPLAVMDCRWITAMRTGAASAVAAKFLAQKKSKIVGIVGAGIQGRYNLIALSTALSTLKVVKVFDTNLQATKGMIAALCQILALKIEIAKTPEEVIEDACIVVTATGMLNKPIFKERWVAEGALVLPVHHRGWENRTLHKMDKFVTDDWRQLRQAHEEVGGFDGPLPELHTELGEIITGQKPGRENVKERIIDFNYGLAIEDAAMATEIYARAKAKGIGMTLPLMKEELPYA